MFFSLPNLVLALVLSQLIAAVLTGLMPWLVRRRFLPEKMKRCDVIRFLQDKFTLLAAVVSLGLSLLLAGRAISAQPLAFHIFFCGFLPGFAQSLFCAFGECGGPIGLILYTLLSGHQCR